MDHRAFVGLQYRGKVDSVRRTYHVLEGPKSFVIASSTAKSGGYFAVVPQPALKYLAARLGGTRSVTTGEALKACSRSKFFPDRFSVLNALYVLVATGQARIARVEGRTLHFSVHKPAR